MGIGSQPHTREYSPNELVTDTAVDYREHDKFSRAKRVISVGALPPIDPSNPLRSLKPTAVVVAAAGVGGFDLDPNSVYRYIADGNTNIVLAAETGITPDVSDLLVPLLTELIINTGTQWRRLEVFSTPGANAQVVKVG